MKFSREVVPVGGPTKHRKEHKGANLNTRISTTRDVKENKGANLFINTRILTRDQFTWHKLST